jgi:long-chain fatty acid transport protein
MNSAWRVLSVALMMILAVPHMAKAEGFAMSEWSARGLSLAGGLVGRADDPSAVAYNPAGITQLEGTQIMVGGAIVAPFGTMRCDFDNGTTHYMQTKPQTWTPVHMYLTHQLSDSLWAGFGVYSRFGVGVSYNGDWAGRYNMYDVGLQTISATPVLAYKVNDWLSLSVGAELLYAHLYEGKKANMNALLTSKGAGGLIALNPRLGEDMDAQIEGQGIAGGFNIAAHAKFNEQWSAGLVYKSQMTLNMAGEMKFDKNHAIQNTPFAGKFQTSDLDGTVQLPDSLAFAITYKPTDTLSFEVGTVWTRWSTYDHLNIYVDKPADIHSKNRKNCADGWNFNASVEWKTTDWLTLRGGAYIETPVVDEKYSDFMIPSHGRTGITAGAGFNWGNFTLDLAYAHLFINQLDYDDSRAEGLHGYVGGHSEDCVTNIYSASLTYRF